LRINTAHDALLMRRPEIQYVALSCANTNVVIPYIDLVNEILESAIAPTTVARSTVTDTEGTSSERRALPQQSQPLVAAAAYAATAEAVFPLSLPFDQNFARTTAYIAALGTTRSALLNLFPADPATIACATIGINPALQKVINQANTIAPWTRWGLVQNPSQVIDPKTRRPYTSTPSDWVAALNRVPVLLSRAGLSLRQLYQLLEVVWVTKSNVTLGPGATTVPGTTVSILSPDIENMIFTGLDGSVLDRANRFLRLWRVSGLKMWELDWALGGAALDDSFLIFLSGAIAVRDKLNLPLQEILSFWGTIETRDVTSHLGNEDIMVPSTYSEVFASPTVLASWKGVFGNPASLSGAQIVSANPSATALQPLNGIIAALGLSSADISAILEASDASNALDLPTLTVLLRYARLAKSLSLSVPDLILWIALTGGKPFDGTPADTMEFLRRLAVLERTGISVRDLDYLLRGHSASESPLAFTGTQTAAVLQTVRDAVAKAVATNQLSLTSVSDTTPIIVGTAKPHGLTTGAQVFITGAQGNTAANGIFTITASASDLTLFSLNGSAGNGPWSGGGTATANLDTAIETIVIAALVTATGVTADVVAPVLKKTGALPLKAETTALLVAPSQSTIDVTQFPVLTAAVMQVAKACILFTALAPSPFVFSFLVQNAGKFRWLDPSALPIAAVTSSSYEAFEALLRALSLQQRQKARTPKLFDVLGQWLTGKLPANVSTAINGDARTGALSLAQALNASVADVTTIATALRATAPSFDTHQPKSLADIATLTAIANALDIVTRYGISGATLIVLTAPQPSADQSDAAMRILQAQYPQTEWLRAVQPIEDNLRQVRRDALVAYLLGAGPVTSPGAQFFTTDDIFDYYLIDPEMCACGETTRLLQPSLAIQQFVQQCFLNLSIGVTVEMTGRHLDEWSWRQQYRLWQANREVFLHPENYVLPETRTNASSFFADFENDLRKSNCDADAAEAAFENYLRKLVDVSRLVVAAHCIQTNLDQSTILHVFAHTRTTPRQWYYRTRTTRPPAPGIWSPWTSLNLDIASDQLMPVMWDRRLHLVWPIFKQISEKQDTQPIPKTGGGTSLGPQKFYSVQLAMSQLSAGQWQAKRTLDEKMYFGKIFLDPTDRRSVESPLAFTFLVNQQASLELSVATYFSGTMGWHLPPGPEYQAYNWSALRDLAAKATLQMPDAPLSISETVFPGGLPPPKLPNTIRPPSVLIDISQEQSYALVRDLPFSGMPRLPAPPGYRLLGQDLVFDYSTSNQGTPVPLTLFGINLLEKIVDSRVVVSPNENEQLLFVKPFFVAEPTRTYLVQPHATSTATYDFETFYHPYAQTFLRELEIGGVSRLMSRNLQTDPQVVRGSPITFNFQSIYAPSHVSTPYPGTAGASDAGETWLDFDASSRGAYSLYNWELFYHAPMFGVASYAESKI
jgi:hypothetical protein